MGNKDFIIVAKQNFLVSIDNLDSLLCNWSFVYVPVMEKRKASLEDYACTWDSQICNYLIVLRRKIQLALNLTDFA